MFLIALNGINCTKNVSSCCYCYCIVIIRFQTQTTAIDNFLVVYFFHRAYFFVGCAHQCHIQMPYHLQFILRTSRIVYIVGKCVCTTFRTTPWWHRPNAYYCQTTTTLIVSLNRTKESEKGSEWKRQRERESRSVLTVLPVCITHRMNLWPVFCLLPHNILYCNGMGVLFAQITIKTFSGKNKQREEETAKLNRKKTYHFWTMTAPEQRTTTTQYNIYMINVFGNRTQTVKDRERERERENDQNERWTLHYAYPKIISPYNFNVMIIKLTFTLRLFPCLIRRLVLLSHKLF